MSYPPSTQYHFAVKTYEIGNVKGWYLVILLKHKSYNCCGFSLSVDTPLRIEFDIRKMSVFCNLSDFFGGECLVYCVNVNIVVENGFGFQREIYSGVIESDKRS